MIHLGWTIKYLPSSPPDLRWRATKGTEGMNAGTYGALVKMIDQKVVEGYWPAAWRAQA